MLRLYNARVSNLLIHLLDDGVGEVVADDVGVAVALCCHDGSAYLAQSDTVSPSLAVEGEDGLSAALLLADGEG